MKIYAPVQIGTDAHNAAFDATGHLTWLGNGRPWRDEICSILALLQTGAGISYNNSENTTDYLTSANLSDYAYGNVQLNHDKDLTAGIYPHIHWFQAQANTPNWLLRYRWQSNGAAKATAWADYKMNTNALTYTSGTIMQISYGAAIAVPAGTGLSDILQVRIIRDSGNASGVFAGADPYTATVGALSFDVHVQINSAGSTDEM